MNHSAGKLFGKTDFPSLSDKIVDLSLSLPFDYNYPHRYPFIPVGTLGALWDKFLDKKILAAPIIRLNP